jgi:hypothetical protein
MMETRLGFGCAKLTHHFSARAAISNLETAYDQGVTHFDVARSYGFGAAERILGQFASKKRDKVTIATKLGIWPANPMLKNLVLQNVLRRSSHWLRPRAVAHAAANLVSTSQFTVQSAERSLHTSLRELGTDYVDYLLLHEATVNDARQADIQAWLERTKSKGMVRAYGIGSYADQLLGEVAGLPTNYQVLQTDHSFPFASPLPAEAWPGRQLFFFSPFRYAEQVGAAFGQNPELKARVADLLDIDLDQHRQSLFLMQGKLFDWPNTTLFASSSDQRIKSTIAQWQGMEAPSQSLRERFGLAQTVLAAHLKR